MSNVWSARAIRLSARGWMAPCAITVLALLAGGILVDCLRATAAPSASQLALALLFTAFMTLAWLFPLPLGDQTKLYLDTTITIGAILYFETGIAMAIVGAGTLFGQVIRSQPWDQAIFNSVQVMLQAATGSAVLSVIGWDVAQSLDSPTQLLGVCIAGTVVSVVNLLAVATIVGVRPGSLILPAVARTLGSLTMTDYLGQAVQIVIGLILATLATTVPWTVTLLLAPSAAVYWVLRHNIALRQRLARSLLEREVSLQERERIAKFGSWEWDLASGVQRWSDELYRMVGVRPRGVTPTVTAFLHFVHPAERTALVSAFREAEQTCMPVDVEHRLVRVDGRESIVQTHADIICDAAGRPVRMVGTIQDITVRKSLEAQLLRQISQSQLTARERDVLVQMARGHSNKEIAAQLGISEQTVKNHVGAIMRKLRVNDRTQAVVVGLRQGWINLDDAENEQFPPGV